MPAGSSARGGARALQVVLLVLCQSMQSLTYGGIALFLPLIRDDLRLSYSEGGILAASASLSYAAMQLPAGYLADRLGPRRVFLVGLIVCNLLALSLAQLHDFRLIALNQMLTGIFRALVFAPGLLLAGHLFPPARRATALGLYVAGGFSSNVLLNLFGPLLVRPFGWRALFVAFALGGLLVLAIYARFGDRGPASSGAAAPGLRESAALLKNRAMLIIAGIQYVRLSLAAGLYFWLPTLIVVEKHFSLTVAGLLIAMAAALTAPSNFLGGYLSDRLRNPLLVVGLALAVLSAATAALAVVQGLLPLVIVMAVYAVFVQLYFGPLFAVPIEIFGGRVAGLTSGFGNLFANLGNLTFGLLFGVLKDATGTFATGLYLLSGLCLAGLALTLLLVPIRRRALALSAAEAGR